MKHPSLKQACTTLEQNVAHTNVHRIVPVNVADDLHYPPHKRYTVVCVLKSSPAEYKSLTLMCKIVRKSSKIYLIKHSDAL